MTVSSTALNSNEKRASASSPVGGKKRKKAKKKKKDSPAKSASAKTYEQITPESFIIDPADWLEASDELSFDDIQAALSQAMQDMYGYKNGITGSGYDTPSSGCRYYCYKVWPDKVVCKRSYSNKDEDDPLFMMHSYTIEDGKAVLDYGVPVEMGFVPLGSESEEFLTAVREVDEMAIDDPEFSLAEDDEGPDDEDDPDADDVDDDDDVDSDDDAEEADSDEEDVQEATLREDIANLSEQDFTEQLDCVIDEHSRIVEAKNGSFIIENMAVIGSKSKNKRNYPAETRKKALKVFEGAKAYANHPKKGEEDDPRGIYEMIGRHRNLTYDSATDMVRSRFTFYPTAFVKETILPIIKTDPSALGNSINASGKIDSEGNVLEITKVRSIDLVTEPATTSGIFESVQSDKQKQTSEGGEKNMMTLKEILENKELAEEARAHFREELEVELSVDELQEENSALKEEVASYKMKEKIREDKEAVEKIIAESKLPDEAKADKELREILEEAKPERRTAIIARFEKVAEEASNGKEEKRSVSREKDLQEQVEPKKLVVGLYNAFTGGRR